MPKDDRRGASMKDQRYRERDPRDGRDRDRDRESRDRDRGGDRDRGSNMVSTTTSSNSKDRKASTSSSSSRGTSSASTSSAARRPEQEENHKDKLEKEAPAGSNHEDAGFVPNVTPQELFARVVEYENNEAKNLDVDGHLKAFQDKCKKVEMLMDELYELKLRGEMKTPTFSRKQLECIMKLNSIREMNRLYKLRLKIAKDSVSEQRQKVDTDHLRLQNLIYEATHLNDQVSAVQDYKGFDEDIELIPVDQFYKEAPPSITRGDATKNNPHLLKVARLEYEYTQRQTLTEQCAELDKDQERLSAEILERQAKLSSILPMIDKILEASTAVEDFFQLDITSRRKMDELSKLLPVSLHTLYTSSVGYADAESSDEAYEFKVNIVGDVEAAKQMSKRTPPNLIKGGDLDDISPMEIDDEDGDVADADADQEKEDEDVSNRRKLKKHLSVLEEKKDSRAKIVEKHPLYIEWTIELPDGETFVFNFYHIIRLNTVTVTVNVNMKNLPWRLASFLSKSEHILADLYDDDAGEDCPNPSAAYTLGRADVENFSELIPEIGYPYKWVQKISGLLFVADDSKDSEQEVQKSESVAKRRAKVSTATLPGALKLLTTRATDKVNLWKLLRSLESGKIVLPSPVAECFSSRNAATFNSMDPIEYIDYQKYECTKGTILDQLTKPSNLFLKFTMQLNNRKLVALVSISQDYPKIAPTFDLILKEGEHELQEMNGHPLRKIQKEVTRDVPHVFGNPDYILAIQLRILRDRLDNIPLVFSEVAQKAARLNRA